MPHICSICNKLIDEGTDLFLGCPSCGGKKFHFVRSTSGRGREGQKDWEEDPGQEAVITKEMGVRVPPRRSTVIDAATRDAGQGRKGGLDQSRPLAGKGPGETIRDVNRAAEAEPARPDSGEEKERLAQPVLDKVESRTASQTRQPHRGRAARGREDIIKRSEGASQELNPVESIKIKEPGTYELNLPFLFNREGLVMAVKEGTYLIDLSTAFRRSKKQP